MSQETQQEETSKNPKNFRSSRGRQVLAVVLLALVTLVVARAWAASRANPTPVPAPIPIVQPGPPATDEARIEVVFVLDTTGSMSGLIEGAKSKIWSIANQLASNGQGSGVRMGLTG